MSVVAGAVAWGTYLMIMAMLTTGQTGPHPKAKVKLSPKAGRTESVPLCVMLTPLPPVRPDLITMCISEWE